LRHPIRSDPTEVTRMYIPASFAEPDVARLHDFMRQHSFALLTSLRADGLFASHLPLLLDAGAGPHGHLCGHMARANPQWRDVRGEVLAVFSGPHAYVSPSWYDEPGTVPTWNYVAVHARGTFQIVEQRDDLLRILRRSLDAYEGPRPKPWVFDESNEVLQRMLQSIIGFRVEITCLEGKWKLGQNHSEARRERVVRALKEQPDEDSQRIAALMEQALKG
jgi:transcriptional regulator